MRVLRSPFLPAVLATALAGCSMFDSPTPTGATPIIPKPIQAADLPFPFDRTLVAVSYKDQRFKDDRPSILVSQNNRGTGYSACNNWSATVLARKDNTMAVGPVAISKRVCDARLMHNEQVFLFVLKTAAQWKFDGRTLTINGPYGPMTFEPAA
ncbi:META domain-containing protein [Labrys wisconsinensis]|uniref:Heat shock protein HslJ n=1 Tax=Labrys wisconsinensis TaxID=425677 RepID=A0ABU0JEH1_9HYPH|nr:META domain-containing protein [Labrys wisconsinensis]MDQ0472676.1 heat shock protein HslJ [Labrys wisconsinensis]